MFHTLTWVIWLAAAAVPAFTLSNPLYLVLTLGAAWIVYAALGRSTPMGSSWGGFVKIGLFFLALTIPFNALSIHAGRILLFRLPQSWPIVGGAITLEAVLAGVVSGLSLLTILLVFAAFNAIVDHYQLLRATPAFLFQAGVVVSIAVTFVPQMVLSAREIREAQRIRGHRFRGIRDLLPLIVPLLASALERAIQLAETMEARGFGSAVRPPSRRQAAVAQWGTLAALLALLTGLFLVTYRPEDGFWGWLLAGSGVAGLSAIFWLQGQSVRRSRYRSDRWTMRDSVVAAASMVELAVVVAVRLTGPEALVYSPYPPYPLLPPFHPGIGAALLLLALPAILAPRRESVAHTAGRQRTASKKESVP
jgi:energy-coupling factor transport system permease protein